MSVVEIRREVGLRGIFPPKVGSGTCHDWSNDGHDCDYDLASAREES
jgi:hypothetical protein